VWRSRFSKSGELVAKVFENLINASKGTDVPDLVEFATSAEGSQSYLWAYVDYCFRTPIYRTLQWIDYNLRNQSFWELIARGDEGREFLKSLTIHILKEYTLMWSRIMDELADTLLRETKGQGELPKVVREVLGPDVEDGTALSDLKGVATELKAFYVLVDHRKPFLPFSIMQSPITPSYIRPGASSGDLYLFEENLVVDVKSGRLDRKTELPTYYYGREANLSVDLGKVSDLHNLYGIRKGIGVVADEGEHIHFAVYVPWRRWRVEGPLLHLRSLKLPLLVYVNNVGRTGVAHHRAAVTNSEVRLTVKAYDLRKESAENLSSVTLSFLRKPDVRLEGSITRDTGNPRKATMEFAADIGKARDSIVVDDESGKHVVLAKLLVRYGGEELEYPLLAATD